MKSAFTLLEIIVVIVIIAIISSMGVYKLFFSVNESYVLQLKTQVQLIKNAIVHKQNQTVLLGQSNTLSQLDDASVNTQGEKLFNHILHQTIISSSDSSNEIGNWIKSSATSYKVYLPNNKSLLFTYSKNKATFDCDYNKIECKEFYE